MAVNIGPRIGIEGESEYRNQIKQIISTSKTLASEMKALTSSFDKNGKTLEQNAKQQKLFQEQIKNQETRVAAVKDMLAKATQAYEENRKQLELHKNALTEDADKIRELERAVDTSNAKMQQYQTALNNATADLNTMKSKLDQMPSSLDMVADKCAQMGEKLKGIGDSISGLGTKLTASLTVPITAAATKAVTSFAEVDKTMQLTNSTMGNTADQAKLLNDAMESAAANSTFAMSDAATATLNFARAGLTATEAADALAPAMNLAAGEGGELEIVSAGLVATINGFGDSFDQTTRYADVFANACNNSALDVNSLSESLSVAAPIFNAAGYEIEDATLYLGTMANAGIDANTAANSLKTGLARLVKPAKEGSEMMEQLGINVTNADGSMKDAVTIQRELHDTFAQLSESEQIAAASAIFGKNQMSNWLALVNTAPADVEALNEALYQEGTTASMANAMMGGFGGSIEKLKSSIDVLMTSLGSVIADYLSPIIEKIQAMVDGFNNMSEAEKDQVVRIAAMVAAIGPLLVATGKLISGVGTVMTWAPKIATLLQKVSTLFSGLSVTTFGALAPIIAIGAAIAVLVGAFVHLWNTNEQFRDHMTNIWNYIKEAFVGFVSQVQERLPAISEAFSNVVSVIKPLWEGLCAILAPIFEGAFEMVAVLIQKFLDLIVSIIDIITGIFTLNKEMFLTGLANFFLTLITFLGQEFAIILLAIKNVINVILGFFGTSLEQIWTAIKTAFTNIITTVTEKMVELRDIIFEKFEEVTEFIGSLPERFYNWGVEMISNLINGILSMVDAVGEAIGSVAEKIAEFIHFSEPDRGALAHFNEWMPDMMKQMAEQIEGGRYQVQLAASHVAADIATPLGTTQTFTLNNSFTFNGGYTEADGRTIARQINRQLGALYI